MKAWRPSARTAGPPSPSGRWLTVSTGPGRALPGLSGSGMLGYRSLAVASISPPGYHSLPGSLSRSPAFPWTHAPSLGLALEVARPRWLRADSALPPQSRACPSASSAASFLSLTSWRTPSGRASSGSTGTRRTTSSPPVRSGAGTGRGLVRGPSLWRGGGRWWRGLRGFCVALSPLQRSSPWRSSCSTPSGG